MRRRRANLALALATLVALGALALGLGGSSGDSDRERSRSPRSGERQRTATTTLGATTPASVEETAEVLGRVEPALRGGDPDDANDDGDPERRRALGRSQQLAYRALSLHPEWLEPVAATLPAETATVVRANVAAGAALSALVVDAPLATALPEWHIVAPAPPEELLGYYREAEAAYQIPWVYFAAIHFVETRFGRIVGPSSAGAQGPMQFIPSTWEIYGEGDIYSNRDAILAAGRYLSDRGGPADMDRALFAYNNHDRYVEAIQAYAGVLLADARAYDGYYQWQTFYRTTDGLYLIPEGYPEQPAVRQHG